MSKSPKKLKKSTSTSRAPARAASARAAVATPPQEDLPAVAELVARLPRLDDDARTSFREAHDDGDCMTLGARTKSARVYRNGVKWAAQGLSVLEGPYAARVHFGPLRLAWLVELLLELGRVRGLATAVGDAGSGMTSERFLADATARARRKTLLDVLDRVAKGRAKEAAIVANASKPVAAIPELERSLRALVDLGKACVESHDKKLRARVLGANLTRAFVDEAAKDLAALGAADKNKQLGTVAAGGRDTPDVNAVEGRVLFEMIGLRDAFDAARTDGVPVARLVPDAGLTHVLARTRADRAAATTDPSAGAATP